MPELPLDIIPLCAGPFETACYVVGDRASAQAVVVDAAGDPSLTLDALSRAGWDLGLIVCTHGHVDHIQSAGALKQATSAPVAIHAADAACLTDPLRSGATLFGLRQEPCAPDRLLADGDMIEVGEALRLRVLHTPGHSPGSICLVGDGFAFVGDLVFAGSIGRTDLPGGSDSQMLDSLRSLLTLPDATQLLCGHGPATTVGEERRHNPFLALS